jgi:hypothetical protein
LSPAATQASVLARARGGGTGGLALAGFLLPRTPCTLGRPCPGRALALVHWPRALSGWSPGACLANGPGPGMCMTGPCLFSGGTCSLAPHRKGKGGGGGLLRVGPDSRIISRTRGTRGDPDRAYTLLGYKTAILYLDIKQRLVRLRPARRFSKSE